MLRHRLTLLLFSSLTFWSYGQEAEPTKPTVSTETIDDAWSAEAELKRLTTPIPPPTLKKLWSVRYSEGFRDFQVGISATGNRLITFSERESRVWDAQTGRIISRYRLKPPNKILSAALSAEGEYGIVGLETGGAMVWNAETAATLFEHRAPEAPVKSVAISRDGQWVGIGDLNNVFHRYPLLGGKGHAVGLVDSPRRPGTEVESISGSANFWGHLIDKSENALVLGFADDKKVGTTLKSFSSVGALTVTDRLTAGIQTHGGVVVTSSRPGGRILTFNCPFPGMAGVLTDNGEELRIVAQGGWLDCRLPRYPDYPVIAKIGTYGRFGIHKATICPTRLRIAIMGIDDLAVWDSDDVPQCEGWRFATTLHRMMRKKQFDRLDALAGLLQHDPEPFLWQADITKYATFQSILQLYPGILDEGSAKNGTLEAWLEARPESPTARLMLAASIIREGWQHRGSGFAATVTEDGWKKFHESLRHAHVKLQPLLRDASGPPEAFTPLFEIAKGESWEGSELQPYVEQLFERHPAYFQPHICMVEKLMPRWGGEMRDSVNYADDVARRVGGDAGEMIYARLGMHLVNYYGPTEIWEATGFDYERVQQALAKRLETVPLDKYAATSGLAIAFWRKDLPRTKWYSEHLAKHQLAPAPTRYFGALHYVGAKQFAKSDKPGGPLHDDD